MRNALLPLLLSLSLTGCVLTPCGSATPGTCDTPASEANAGEYQGQGDVCAGCDDVRVTIDDDVVAMTVVDADGTEWLVTWDRPAVPEE